MTREEEIQKIWQESLLQRNGCGTTVIACLVLVILLFCSCATKKEIEYRDRIVEKEIVKEVHDTLLESVHDSVFQTVYQKGDTVYSEKYVEHTKWRAQNTRKQPRKYKKFLKFSGFLWCFRLLLLFLQL